MVTMLFLIVFPAFVIKSMVIFIPTVFFGSLGFAAVATIIAAIITKAQGRGTLYTVLSFPILAPLLLTVINATALAIEGEIFFNAVVQLQIMIGYLLTVVGLSYLMFEFVWKD
jgi:heme exporter protein B